MTVTITKKQISVALKYGYVRSALSNKQWDDIIQYSMNNKADYDNQQLEDKVCNYIANNAKAPITVLFSGGVDSTFMLCMVRRCFSENKINTVTVRFNEPKFDESNKAQAVLDGLKFKGQTYLVPVKDPFSVLEKITADNYNELFFSSSIVPTYTAMSAACELGNYVLTGDGGDELFGGYDRYLWWKFKDNHKMLAFIASKFKGNNKQVRNNKLLATEYEDLCSIWSVKELDLLGLNVFDILKDPIFKRYGFVLNSDIEMHKRMMLMDIGTELYGVEKYKVDQAYAMSDSANSKVVSPFMDLDILKYCMTLPTKSKISGWTRKVALRDSIKKRFPGYDKVAGKRKKGFGAPVSKWVDDANNYSLENYFNLSKLNSVNRHKNLFSFRIGSLGTLVARHIDGYKDYGEKLWALTTLLYLVNKGVVEVQ